MDDRTMDSTYDPSKPWHVLMMRGDRYHIVSTFDHAVEVILAVGAMVNPGAVVVRHIPTDTDGRGTDFLREVNRRMRSERVF